VRFSKTTNAGAIALMMLAVMGVYVESDQFVKVRQVIVDLDPRDYQVVLQQTSGAYAQAVAQLQAESPNVPIIVTTNETTFRKVKPMSSWRTRRWRHSSNIRQS
jgi:hypothetical protein